MSSSGGDGGSRVSIPADLRDTIKNISEVTGKKHSDEDIFTVFKDCFNDPHETAQKLLYLDTFHEVRGKREKKKENLVPIIQGRGRNGRRDFASDGNSGRNAAFRRQSGANHRVRGSRTASAHNKSINDTIPCSINQSLSKPTSSSEDVVELKKSEDSVVPVAVSVSDSVVQTDSQYDAEGTSQISQQDQVTRSEVAANESKNQSLLESDVSERPHVTFPVHLQDAKMLANGLTFGSFDSSFVKEASSDNCSIECDNSNIVSFPETAAHGASAREDMSSTFSQDQDHDVSDAAPETEVSLQSDQTFPEGDKLKENFVPITDTHQAANCDAPAISYQDQYSIAAYQQAMHLFRQQYPLNFFPFGPYYPPLYMPQPYINQFLSPNGFQQQSYLPPGDGLPAHTGDTLPPPHIKSESNVENSPPTTVPSLYDPYTVAAFNNIPSAATINSTQKEELKENIYTTGPLSQHNLQANPMYNLPFQGQPLGFPTVQAGFPGIYQPTHPILPAPTITAPIGLPQTTNQQPQAAVTNMGNNFLVKES
ncbi:unnamed protein product [Microthlaspi erraticum]|uniref:GBF-interacting protein 1 N-terminal domain-containing protein n=1 Tax=Microthlaspi erraticum TaxID=1685480 RepID=A0A6D2HP18_9BRAS|nr:unnamed protein product [Microthlaspi erraticum]